MLKMNMLPKQAHDNNKHMLKAQAHTQTHSHTRKYTCLDVNDFENANQVGTLTSDVAKAVREMRAGRCEFRMARDGQIMTVVGKVIPAEDSMW